MSKAGETAVERDQQITDKFIEFQKQDSDKPYFGFLFYDAAHGTVFPEPEFAKFKPYWERVDHILLNNDFDASLYHNRYTEPPSPTTLQITGTERPAITFRFLAIASD